MPSFPNAVPVRLSLALSVGVLAAVAGCTTEDPMDLPDVVIALDGGTWDTGVDGGFPDPTVDTCRDPGATIGNACSDPSDCDDGCFCNGTELCQSGQCVAGTDPCENETAPDGTLRDVECTDEACLEETNQCFHMPNHASCSDGLACNGYEQCDRSLGCVAAAPLYCNDESACTVDSCDDTMGCVYTPRDLDGDGYLAGTCGGDDCDDDRRWGADIHPGAMEVCDNRRDDDCDGTRDFNDDDCLPTNNTCDVATVLPARSGTYSGSTEGLTGNYSLACSTSSGPDAVFRFHLDEPHDVRASVGGVSGAAIALRTFANCATGPELKCSSIASPSVLARSLPAGDYALIVRTPSGTPFDIQLVVSDPTVAPAVDQCNAGTEAITASGAYTGRFEETSDDYSLTCHAGSGFRDAVYRLVLDAPSDVVLSATTSGSFTQTYLSLTTDCSMTSATLTCSSGSPSEIRRRGMPAGTYYVMLESSDNTSVDWTLNVTITTPPAPRQAGDACVTAAPVTLSGTSPTLTGSATAMLTGAENDGGTSCGGTGTGNRDVYFTFTTDSTLDVTLTTNVTGATSTFHYVSLQTTCGMTGSELRCRNNGSTIPYVQTFRSLPAGTYYVAVASASTIGNVSLQVTTAAATAIPPNDRCSGAIDMSAGGLRPRDTLTGFEDDVMGTVGSGYPDAFYTFTLTERRSITLIASPLMTSNIYLYLRASCSATTNITSATGTGGSPATIVRTLDPGTYVVIVEEPPTTAGDFSIRLISDPAP